MRNFLERGMRMDDIQNQNIDDLLQQENSVKHLALKDINHYNGSKHT